MDRRTAARKRTLFRGRLEHDSIHSWGLDGTAKDVSEVGARIVVSKDAVVPTTVSVRIGDGEATKARKVWERDGVIGLAFEPPCPRCEASSWDGKCRRASERERDDANVLQDRIGKIVRRSQA